MISSGHARALIGIEDEEQQYAIATKIFDEKLSVRETEKLVKALNAEKEQEEVHVVYDVDHTKALEQKVQSIIGHTVKIVQNGKKSSINIGFSDNDDLERILTLLCGEQFTNEL